MRARGEPGYISEARLRVQCIRISHGSRNRSGDTRDGGF